MPLAHLAIAHPALVVRGQPEVAPDQITALRRAREFLHGEREIETEPFSLPDRARARARLTDCQAWLAEAEPLLPAGLILDIEAAGRHPVHIGLLPVEDLELYLGVRFRDEFGTPAFERLTEAAGVMRFLSDIFARTNVPLITWNGDAYDVPELHRLGFAPAGPSLDMMTYRRINWPGFPASLQECATSVLGWRNWKRLIRDDEREVEQ